MTNELTKLYIGCGKDRLEGYIHVDPDESVNPSIVAYAGKLPQKDDSVDHIETRHLFEHLAYDRVPAILKEWHRVLKPGGTLAIECPDIRACLDLIESDDPEQVKYGQIGLYGHPDDIYTRGRANVLQMHKSGWTEELLMTFLEDAGFDDIRSEDVTQTWREAYRFNRDMRIVAAKSPHDGDTDLEDEE